MESYNQGLHLRSSQEMFVFSAWETLFMVSMAMSYFYSWQTYSLESAEVNPVELSEVVRHTAAELRSGRQWIC